MKSTLISALPPRQALFVLEYMKDLHGTDAAIRAGFTPKSAHVQASRMLKNDKVVAAIDEQKAEQQERLKIDADYILKRLGREAEADIADLYDDDGNILPIKEWPLIWRQGLVSGIDVEDLYEGRGQDRERVGTVIKIRLSDRIKRIELLGKHTDVQAFKEKVELGDATLEALLATGKVKLDDDGK